MTLHGHRRSSIRARVGLVAALAALGCSGPPETDFVITPPPGPPAFNLVGEALSIHCGTLNCHGNEARNMRIFGYYGIRINDSDRVNFNPTTGDEYDASYKALISIEPERLSQIVRSHGSNVPKWIVFSKGRGTENHKGGTRMVQGDAMDTCLLSWVLATSVLDAGPGTVNAAACTAAATVLPPGTDWSEQH